MANSENQVELKLNLDISGVQQALYDMIGQFNGTDKEFDKISKKIQESFKNLEATIKRFGANSDEAAAAAKRYSNTLTALIANGVNPGVDAFNRLDNAMIGASSAANAVGGSIKKSNRDWTNIALVVQDLPFGFRGIQNNLPALAGSFAAVTGPIYLAISAIIALITIFEKDIAKLFNTVSDGERKQKAYNESLEAAKQSYIDASVKVKELTELSKEAAGDKDKEKRVVDEYNESIGKSIGKLNTFKQVQDSLINQGDKYVNYIFLLNSANAAAAKVAEESANKMIASFKKPEEFITDIEAFASAQFNVFGNLSDALLGFSQNLAKKGQKNQQQYLKDTDKNIEAAKSAYEEFKKLAKEAAKGLNFGTFGDLTEKDKIKEEKIQYFDLTKAVDQYYNSKLDFATKDDEAQKKILQSQQATYDDLLLNNLISTVEWYDKTADIYKKIYDLNEKITNKQISDNKELNQITKQRYKDQLSDIDQYYNNLLDFAENDRNAQKEILMQKNADLTAGLMIGAITYDDYVKRIADNTKKIGQINKSIAEEAYKSLLQIGNGLMNALGPSFDMLIEKGMSLGEVLTNAFQGLLKQLAKVVALALAAVTLMSILFPGKLAAAGGFNKVLGGLIGQGMGLGGLIGGGANAAGAVDASTGTNAINNIQSSLPSNDGGSFVLRGNDLVLALNRSENSLNLRRGV